MPLDNSGTKMVLNRYGNLITTKDRTLFQANADDFGEDGDANYTNNSVHNTWIT